MNNEKDIMINADTVDGEIEPMVSIPYEDLSLTTQNLLYSVNLKDEHAMQNFAINGSEIYTTQRKGQDVILAKSTLSGTTATQSNSFTVTDAGHGQTLEYIKNGDFAGSLLFSFNANSDNWSTEIGILDMEKFNATSICDYSKFKRFTDLNYANTLGDTNPPKVIRADAALSTNQSTIIIWTRDEYGLDVYAGYDFDVFCSELKKSTSNTVSFKNNSTMAAKCQFCFIAEPTRVSIEVPKSFQGIELSNKSNGVHSIYIVSGNESNGSNRIYRLTSSGIMKKAIKIIHPYFNPSIKYEIEGVKISGDNLLFGLVRAGSDADKKKPFIMKTLKSTFQ